MKNLSIVSAVLLVFVVLSYKTNAQPLKPKITFEEDPLTHNVHIASDGTYYYTVNGGKANKGQINKYSFAGKLLDSYEMQLDMRSIMYNSKEKLFYVCTFEQQIYRITDLQQSRYELVKSEMYGNGQANLAMSPDGKYIYYFDNGTLQIFKFPEGKKVKENNGFDCGKETTSGNSSVAVDGKHIYTWNADYKMIFVYDTKGNKIKTVEIEKGSYGFSLSYANGLVFVADDGDYATGTWYGYDLWGK
jgi:DNA-binding beta-propeller fold protein YncE